MRISAELALATPEMSGARAVAFCIQECGPCEVAKAAFDLLANDAALAPWEFHVCEPAKGDKKSLGKLFLAGVRHFPTIRIITDGTVRHVFEGLPPRWSGADLAGFLRSRLSEAGTRTE